MLRSSISAGLCLFAGTLQLAIAQDAPLNQKERSELSLLRRDLEKSCLASTQAKRPPQAATDYVSRVGRLMFQLQEPERFCSCVGQGIEALPPKTFRSGNQIAFNAHVTTASNVCTARLWRHGFETFCNGLRTEMVAEFGPKLGEVDVEKSQAICACAASRLQTFNDTHFAQWLTASSDEMSNLAGLNRPITASNASLSGVFASCGAGRMSEAFGFTLPR